ncbi:MAG: hydrogenase maturation nickel metallochaperone HypA [Anaerolineae bacterium]
MHELAVTESMLDLVQSEARKVGATRVTKVCLVLGEMSSIVEESVRFYWEMISPGTLAEGAELEFRPAAPRAACRACGTEYVPESRDMRCPSCGEALAALLAGDEFRVEAIEVE